MKVKLKEQVSMKGHYKFIIRDAETGIVKRVYEYDNIIPTAARSAIVNRLVNPSPTYTLYTNYAALGTGATTPANSDTSLETEVYRKLRASWDEADNVAYITAFYSATDVDGTFTEAGIFIDGTASADTGLLLSRVAINITKSSSESLTLEWNLTIN